MILAVDALLASTAFFLRVAHREITAASLTTDAFGAPDSFAFPRARIERLVIQSFVSSGLLHAQGEGTPFPEF
jgi:hypothetical protein